MTQFDSRRKYRLFLLCLLLSSESHGFVSSRSTTRRRPSSSLTRNGDSIILHRTSTESTRTASRDLDSTRRMISRSREVSSTRQSDDIRKIEQEIVRLGRAGKTDAAIDLYYSVDKSRVTIRVFNGVLDACSRARPTRLQQAFDIFDQATQDDTASLKPNVFTFGALMNACKQAGDAEKALQLLQSMQKDYGIEPNAVVYSSAISTCARSRPPQPGQALRLLKEAVEEKKLAMNVVGFNAAISACAQAGDWENAISILTRMVDATDDMAYLVPTPDVVTYGTVLAACEKGEQWDLVLKYADAMQENKLEMDGLAITSCLHACQQLGMAGPALRYLDVMKTAQPVAPKTAKLLRSGARKPLSGPDAVAYRLAISACARGGAWQQGIRLLEDYQKETGMPADVVAYTSAITGCEYAGEWKEAFFLLDKMRKAGVEPNEVTVAAVLGACATACANQNRARDGATGMLIPQQKAMQLLDILKRHPGYFNPNIQVYNAAIRVCAEAGDLKQAFALFDEIKEADIERTEITYGSLMTACERVGCIESASKVFRSLKEDGFEPNEIIYGAAISCCRKTKQSERALRLLRKMMKEGLEPNVATFNTVMIAQAEGRTRADIERAILIYKLMKSKFATEIGRPNRQTYNIMIKFFASVRQPVTAQAFLKQMREDGFKPDVDLFTTTVTAYERTGQPLKALQVMEYMEEDGYDFYSVKILNSAFKKAVKLANKVGQSFSSKDETTEDEKSLKLMNEGENDNELIDGSS